ncbi:MAG TPA: hypothetical protein VG297_16545 [Bryobacteraceae bacterium]|nr:hypothetical protein [Bryobacteraceae bacterium]
MRVIEASSNASPANLVFVKKSIPPQVKFDARLITLGRDRGLTQPMLADMGRMHISQIRRNESSRSESMLNAIRNPAVAVSADMLLFGKDERGPDDEARLQFDAASRTDPREKNIIPSVIENLVPHNTVTAYGCLFSPRESAGDPR